MLLKMRRPELWLSVLVTCAYGWCVFVVYGMFDDYIGLHFAQHEMLPLVRNAWGENGRIVAGLFSSLGFRWAGGVEGLWLLRLLAVAQVAGFAWFLYRAVRIDSDLRGWWIALLTVFSPPFVVYGLWATAFTIITAALLSLVTGMIFEWACGLEERRRRRLWMVACLLLLLLAESLYQPGVGFFLAPFIVRLWRAPDAPLRWNRAIAAAVLYMVHLGFYFLLFKLSTQVLFPHSPLAARGELNLDLFSRVGFMITGPLMDALAHLGGAVGPGAAAFCVVLTTAGLAASVVSLFLRQRLQGLNVLAALAVLVGMAMAPLLAASEAYAPYRTLPFLSFVVVFVAVEGWSFLFSQLPLASRSMAVGLATVVSVGLAGLAGSIGWQGIVKLHRAEYEAFADYLQRYPDALRGPLVYVSPPYARLALDYGEPKHEFNLPDSAVVDFAKPLISVIRHDLLGAIGEPRWPERPFDPAIEAVEPADRALPPGAPADGASFILGELVVGHKSKVSDLSPKEVRAIQHWAAGLAFRLDERSIYSAWLGLLDRVEPGTWRSDSLGILELVPSPEGGIWMKIDGRGWFWARPSSFPWAKPKEGDNWVNLYHAFGSGTKSP